MRLAFPWFRDEHDHAHEIVSVPATLRDEIADRIVTTSGLRRPGPPRETRVPRVTDLHVEAEPNYGILASCRVNGQYAEVVDAPDLGVRVILADEITGSTCTADAPTTAAIWRAFERARGVHEVRVLRIRAVSAGPAQVAGPARTADSGEQGWAEVRIDDTTVRAVRWEIREGEGPARAQMPGFVDAGGELVDAVELPQGAHEAVEREIGNAWRQRASDRMREDVAMIRGWAR